MLWSVCPLVSLYPFMSGTRERSSHASTTENNDGWSKVIPEQGYYYNTVMHASITPDAVTGTEHIVEGGPS